MPDFVCDYSASNVKFHWFARLDYLLTFAMNDLFPGYVCRPIFSKFLEEYKILSYDKKKLANRGKKSITCDYIIYMLGGSKGS